MSIVAGVKRNFSFALRPSKEDSGSTLPLSSAPTSKEGSGPTCAATASPRSPTRSFSFGRSLSFGRSREDKTTTNDGQQHSLFHKRNPVHKVLKVVGLRKRPSNEQQGTPNRANDGTEEEFRRKWELSVAQTPSVQCMLDSPSTLPLSPQPDRLAKRQVSFERRKLSETKAVETPELATVGPFPQNWVPVVPPPEAGVDPALPTTPPSLFKLTNPFQIASRPTDEQIAPRPTDEQIAPRPTDEQIAPRPTDKRPESTTQDAGEAWYALDHSLEMLSPHSVQRAIKAWEKTYPNLQPTPRLTSSEEQLGARVAADAIAAALGQYTRPPSANTNASYRKAAPPIIPPLSLGAIKADQRARRMVANAVQTALARHAADHAAQHAAHSAIKPAAKQRVALRLEVTSGTSLNLSIEALSGSSASSSSAHLPTSQVSSSQISPQSVATESTATKSAGAEGRAAATPKRKKQKSNAPCNAKPQPVAPPTVTPTPKPTPLAATPSVAMGVPLYTHSPAAQAHYMEAMYLRAASRSADPSLPAAVSPHTPSKQLYTPGMPLFTTGASPGAEKSVSTSPDLIAAPINVDEQWGRENEWLEEHFKLSRSILQGAQPKSVKPRASKAKGGKGAKGTAHKRRSAN